MNSLALALLLALALVSSVAVSATTYVTKWTITDEDVKSYIAMGQSLTLAFDVTGSQHLVSWITTDLWPNIEIDHPETYAVYASRLQSLEDGDVIKQSSNPFIAQLGHTYVWSSNQFEDRGAPCPSERICIINEGIAGTVVGISKLNPHTATYHPICADQLGSRQLVRYTPKLTIYASVGASYETSAVIADLGNFNKFELKSVNSAFKFVSESSDWVVST
jgi:hypothetical protein